MSKAKQIEQYLKDGNSITGMTAMDLFGVYRLSSIILRLRQKGLKIITDMVDTYNGERFAEYYIERSQT